MGRASFISTVMSTGMLGAARSMLPLPDMVPWPAPPGSWVRVIRVAARMQWHGPGRAERRGAVQGQARVAAGRDECCDRRMVAGQLCARVEGGGRHGAAGEGGTQVAALQRNRALRRCDGAAQIGAG